MSSRIETEPVVSCMNYNTMLKYLEREYGDIAPILDRYEHGADYISDPNNWISWGSARRLIALIEEFTGEQDPKQFYHIGLRMQELRSVGALEQLVRLLPSPKSVVTRIPELNRRFNHLYDMQVTDVTSSSAVLVVRYRPDFRESYVYEMCTWNQGIVASIPLLWNLPRMNISETHCLFTINEILNRSYSYLPGVDCEYERDRALVNGKTVAQRTASGESADSESFVATRDLAVDGISILVEGVVYGAPYCRYELSWENKGFWRNLQDHVTGRVVKNRDSRRALRQQLEYTEVQFFEIQRLNEELQAHADGLERLVEERTAQLLAEEKERRVYQIRAAQADAVARFLHQTSNLVLQPLASTMIVFEDLMEIADDCRTEWGGDHHGDELLDELDDGLIRVKETYPSASRVIDGYRELFHAFYEVYVSTSPERDVNQDLRYIETLVRSKYILTQVELSLGLDETIPPLKLEGGIQSIFLELMHNAARYGAGRLLVSTAFEPDAGSVRVSFYNDGEPIPEEQWEGVLEQDVSREGRGFGLSDARYIVEVLNGGSLSLAPSDREDFSVLFVIELSVRSQ